jgi:hypothetical protein
MTASGGRQAANEEDFVASNAIQFSVFLMFVIGGSAIAVAESKAEMAGSSPALTRT